MVWFPTQTQWLTQLLQLKMKETLIWDKSYFNWHFKWGCVKHNDTVWEQSALFRRSFMPPFVVCGYIWAGKEASIYQQWTVFHIWAGCTVIPTSEPASAGSFRQCSGDISSWVPMLLHFGALHKGWWGLPRTAVLPRVQHTVLCPGHSPGGKVPEGKR